ncbi:MAG: hypothetical protein H8D23_17005 [Candidatus Brocadiales bacterium]|nr:hypothetical protein [Candidatus Brocadiales bacterium]
MREAAYDKAELHFKEHKSFVEKIAEISGKSFIDNELHSNLSTFLKEWVLNHMLAVDKELAEFLLKYRMSNA